MRILICAAFLALTGIHNITAAAQSVPSAIPVAARALPLSAVR